MKTLDSYFEENEFKDLLKTSTYVNVKKEYALVDSSNEKTKILMLKAEFPYYAKTKLKFIF